MGAGECLIDDVEVLNASGQNVVNNSTLHAGAAGWTAEGTQSASGWSNAGGYGDNGGCYHVRAAGRGDNQLNRLRTPLTATLAGTRRDVSGQGALDPRASGDPAAVARQMARDRGGARNAGATWDTGTGQQPAVANAGPAIYDVTHFRCCRRRANVVVSASTGSGWVGLVQLRYRIDPRLDIAVRDDAG
jgi:hypothetical protein